jgi:Fic family protein
MQIFPFMEATGKVGRLLMNSFLLQGGYDLAIIHQSERQQYYEILKAHPSELRLLLLDSIESSIDSRINLVINYNLSLLGNKSVIRKGKTGVFITP